MKICWDNLANLRYNARNGTWTNGKNTYLYREECPVCGDDFLMLKICGKNISPTCSKSCAHSGKRHWGYIDGMGNDPDRLRENARRNYWANRKKRINQNREYKEKYSDKVKETRQKHYNENANKIREKSRNYYWNHEEEKREYRKKYYSEHKDFYRGKSIKWFNENRDRGQYLRAKRRALKKNLTPTDANLDKIQFLYSVCSETNQLIGERFFHVDHIVPLTKGGLHHHDNLQILEGHINNQKYNHIKSDPIYTGLKYDDLCLQLGTCKED